MFQDFPFQYSANIKKHPLDFIGGYRYGKANAEEVYLVIIICEKRLAINIVITNMIFNFQACG